MDKRQQRLLLENSIERVINTSVRLIEQHVPDTAEYKNVNLEDWEALKWLVVGLFAKARDEAFQSQRTQEVEGVNARWMTYDDLSNVRQIDLASAKRLAKRHGWRREVRGNRVCILVPSEKIAQ